MQDIIKQNKVLVAVLIIILLIGTSLSVARCTSVYETDQVALQDEASQEQADGQKLEENNETDDLEDLNSEFAKLRKDYTIETQEFIALLTANAWSDATEISSISFTDQVMTIKGKDTSEATEYVISALESTSSASLSDTPSLNTEESRIYIAVFTTNDSVSIMRVVRSSSETDTDWSLTCADISNGRSFYRTQAVSSFRLEGNQDVNELLDNNLALLEDEMRQYCAQYFPSATVAVWDSVALVDYEAQTISLSFRLDNQSKTQVTVTYDQQVKEFILGSVI